MLINFSKKLKPKTATILGIIFLLPFSFDLFTAITQFKPFLNIISFKGHVTVFGLALFYIGLLGLPLAFLVNCLSMITIKNGKVTFHPKPNLIIGVIALLVFLIFGGHLLIDYIACLKGNIPACD